MRPAPLRIAFLNSWHRDPARGSGTAVAIAGLAGGIRSLGHEVTLIEPRCVGRAGLRQRVAFNVTARRRLSESHYGLVVGFDLDGLSLSRARTRRYVVALKGIAADELRFERGVARARLWAAGTLEAWNARRADRVVVTSRYARDRAVAAYGLRAEALCVVPEGIPLGFWSAGRGRAGARRPTIVSVARFYPRKNLTTLIAAMPAVREAVPEARLTLIGGGPEDRSLRTLAASLGLNGAVEFTGALADPAAVRAHYRAASVFCLPSLQEGFGIAFLEAMAAGIPVVAGQAGAVPEVVSEEVGYLVPPRDGAALAEAVIRLLRDADLRGRLGDAGRKRAARYDWPVVAAQFLEAALSEGSDP